MPVLSAVNISKTFIKGTNNINALKKVSVSVENEEFVCIMGRSGSGKSTLLNILGLLEIPDSGQLFINGSEITKFSETNLTKIRRNSVGFIFQHLLLEDSLTALENTILPLKYAGIDKKERNLRAIELLSYMGLKERLNFYPTELSGGECQRIAIARAIINEPKIILADEPTSELDDETSKDMVKMLKNLAQQKKVAVIAVTHDTQVLPFADRVLKMNDGELEE